MSPRDSRVERDPQLTTVAEADPFAYGAITGDTVRQYLGGMADRTTDPEKSRGQIEAIAAGIDERNRLIAAGVPEAAATQLVEEQGKLDGELSEVLARSTAHDPLDTGADKDLVFSSRYSRFRRDVGEAITGQRMQDVSPADKPVVDGVATKTYMDQASAANDEYVGVAKELCDPAAHQIADKVDEPAMHHGVEAKVREQQDLDLMSPYQTGLKELFTLAKSRDYRDLSIGRRALGMRGIAKPQGVMDGNAWVQSAERTLSYVQDMVARQVRGVSEALPPAVRSYLREQGISAQDISDGVAVQVMHKATAMRQTFSEQMMGEVVATCAEQAIAAIAQKAAPSAEAAGPSATQKYIDKLVVEHGSVDTPEGRRAILRIVHPDMKADLEEGVDPEEAARLVTDLINAAKEKSPQWSGAPKLGDPDYEDYKKRLATSS